MTYAIFACIGTKSIRLLINISNKRQMTICTFPHIKIANKKNALKTSARLVTKSNQL